MTNATSAAKKRMEWALEYAAAGLQVFPLNFMRDGKCSCGTDCGKNAGKHPIGWLVPHGLKNATTDETTIRSWWARFPDAGVGLVTGSTAGFIVLDIDPRHGGQDSLNGLLTDHGPLPPGPKSKTGGGGAHLFFAHPGGTVGNATGILPGIDLRADGGYIVAPPSGHPSGGTYEWIVPLNSVPLPPPPDWLLDFVNRRREGSTAITPVPSTQLTPDQKIPHGRHHDSIVSTSASLAQRMAGVSFDTLLRAVRAAMSELLDDIDRHENEIADACRSALIKFGRPAPPPPPGDTPPAPDHVVPTEPQTPPPDYFHLWLRNEEGVISGPNRFAFETTMMRESRFIAPTDTEELLRYDSGAYEPAAPWVKAWCQARHAEVNLTASLRFVAECVGGITRSCYVRRDTINPLGYYCLQNGLLHFDHGTFTLGPHDPDIRLTNRLPVAYNPDASCPNFLAALTEMLPSEQTRQLISEEWGYALIPGNPYKRAFFWIGAKNTGKSALLEILKGVVGISNISAVSLHEFSEQRFAKADLYGKLLNIHADLSPRSLKDVGVFKQLLGRDIIRGEKKFLPAFEFVNNTKMYFSANEMPPVPDDEAFFERFIPTEFDNVIPPESRNPHFAEEIVATEGPGILNWMISGAIRLFARGRFDDGGDAETTARTWRRLSNSLVWFCEVAVVRDPTARTPKADLYAAYAQFCADNGLEAKSERVIGSVLRVAFPGVRDGETRLGGRAGKNQKVWYGIRVAVEAPPEEAEKEPESAPETDLRHSWRRPSNSGQEPDSVPPSESSVPPSQPVACQDVSSPKGSSEGSGATRATGPSSLLIPRQNDLIVMHIQDEKVKECKYSPAVARVARETSMEKGQGGSGSGGEVGATVSHEAPGEAISGPESEARKDTVARRDVEAASGAPQDLVDGGVYGPLPRVSRLARIPNMEERSGELRERHPNCPDCVRLGHHVCSVCNACVWYDLHAEEHGIRPLKGDGR